MPSIIIVEDEPHIAEGLAFNLESEGHTVLAVARAEEAKSVFQSYDMMILDIMLPGMSGIDLLKEIQNENQKYPVLILSSKASEKDLIKGLSAGADDYMTKPFSLPELLLRVERILERQAWYNDTNKMGNLFEFGSCWINFETFEAKTNMGNATLTPHETYLMKYLIDNKGRVVSREELLEKVWGYSKNTETRTVDNFIARLRKYFEKDRKTPHHFQSVRSLGYQFSNKYPLHFCSAIALNEL